MHVTEVPDIIGQDIGQCKTGNGIHIIVLYI